MRRPQNFKKISHCFSKFLTNVKTKWEISWNCCGLLRISELSFTDVIRKTSFLLNGQTLDVARKTFKSQRFFHEFKNFYTGSTSHIFTFQDDLTLLYYRVGNEIDFFSFRVDSNKNDLARCNFYWWDNEIILQKVHRRWLDLPRHTVPWGFSNINWIN